MTIARHDLQLTLPAAGGDDAGGANAAVDVGYGRG
jgi:hypothetical protein